MEAGSRQVGARWNFYRHKLSSSCPPSPTTQPAGPLKMSGTVNKSAFNLFRCYLFLLSGDLMIRQNMTDSEPGGVVHLPKLLSFTTVLSVRDLGTGVPPHFLEIFQKTLDTPIPPSFRGIFWRHQTLCPILTKYDQHFCLEYKTLPQAKRHKISLF